MSVFILTMTDTEGFEYIIKEFKSLDDDLQAKNLLQELRTQEDNPEIIYQLYQNTSFIPLF